MKKLLRIVGLLLILAVVAGLALSGPRRQLLGLLTYGHQAREGALEVGDPAPRVPLVGLDGSTRKNLGDWIGPRPLVLIFGSFT